MGVTMARQEKIGQISAANRKRAHRFIRTTTQYSSWSSAVESLARAMDWGHGAAAASLDQLGVVVSAGRKGYSLHIVRGRAAQQVAA